MNTEVLQYNRIDPNQLRQENQIDLVDYVYNQLILNGLNNQAKFFIEEMVKLNITDKTPEVQRYYLNKFFFTQMMSSDEPSFEERFCLVPDGKPEDWAALFTKKIVNYLVRNNLPRHL